MKQDKNKSSVILAIVLTLSLFVLLYLLMQMGLKRDQVLTLTLSLFSLFVACFSVRISRISLRHSVEHDIRSVTPFLEILVEAAHADKEIKILLRNNGIGPACIKNLYVNDSKNPYLQAFEIVENVLGDYDLTEKVVKGTTKVEHYLLPPNVVRTLIHIHFDGISSTDRLKILDQLSNFKIHVDFLDIYEIEYMSTDTSALKPQKPRRPYTCDISLSDIHYDIVIPYE